MWLIGSAARRRREERAALLRERAAARARFFQAVLERSPEPRLPLLVCCVAMWALVNLPPNPIFQGVLALATAIIIAAWFVATNSGLRLHLVPKVHRATQCLEQRVTVTRRTIVLALLSPVPSFFLFAVYGEFNFFSVKGLLLRLPSLALLTYVLVQSISSPKPLSKEALPP